MVMRSGSMPKCSEANHLPVRAKPDCTSSAMRECRACGKCPGAVEIFARRDNKAAFPKNGSAITAADGFRGDGNA